MTVHWEIAIVALAFAGGNAGAARAQSLYEAPAQELAEDAAAASGETVREAIAAALAFAPELDVARSERRAADAERFRALGGFLPDIEASVAYTDDDLRSDSLPTLTDRNGTTLGLSVSQPVFQGLSAVNRYRAARARRDQAGHGLLGAREAIALEAARAHAGVVLARDIVKHRIENLSLVGRQFEAAERRMKAGAQSRTGVEQARMRQGQARVDLGQARAFLADREAAYERVTGRQAPAALAPDPAARADDLEDLQAALDAARADNPALNAARAGARAARLDRNAAYGDFAPQLSIEGNYFRRYGETGLAGEDDEEYQVVARLRAPIFAQGRNVANLRARAAGAAQENARATAAQLAVRETVARSWRQIGEAEAQRLAAAMAIEAAALSVRGLQIEYEAGGRTLIDVLDGQRDLVIAKISLSQAEHDYRIAVYELVAAAGRLAGAPPQEP